MKKLLPTIIAVAVVAVVAIAATPRTAAPRIAAPPSSLELAMAASAVAHAYNLKNSEGLPLSTNTANKYAKESAEMSERAKAEYERANGGK